MARFFLEVLSVAVLIGTVLAGKEQVKRGVAYAAPQKLAIPVQYANYQPALLQGKVAYAQPLVARGVGYAGGAGYAGARGVVGYAGARGVVGYAGNVGLAKGGYVAAAAPQNYQHAIPAAAIRNVEIVGVTKTITPVITKTITRQTHSEPALSIGHVQGYSNSAIGHAKLAPVQFITQYTSYANPTVGVNGPVTYAGPAVGGGVVAAAAPGVPVGGAVPVPVRAAVGYVGNVGHAGLAHGGLSLGYGGLGGLEFLGGGGSPFTFDSYGAELYSAPSHGLQANFIDVKSGGKAAYAHGGYAH